MALSQSTTKKLTQSKISSYFTGCVKSIPTEHKSRMKRRSNYKDIRGMSTPSNIGSQSTMSSLSSLNVSLTSIPKRKLPAEIFLSDDEDDFENNSRTPKRKSSKSPKQQESKSPKQQKVLVALNKPGPSTCQNTRKKWKPLCFSTPSHSDSQDSACPDDSGFPSCSKTVLKDNATPGGSKSIHILGNIVITSPTKDKSPQKKPKNTPEKNQNMAKSEKKVNYEQLKVMREFFVNVQKHKNLTCLLSHNDMSLLQKFFNGERDYQYLCVKLFLWQPIWYNIFDYVEKIGLQMSEHDVGVMYSYLKEQRFVDTGYMDEDTFTLLNLLKLKDVRDILRSFKITPVAGAKETLIMKLLKMTKTQVTLTSVKNIEDVLRERIKERMGFCIKLSGHLYRCLYYLFLLNTFTNPILIEPHDYFKNVTYFNMVFPTYKVENFHVFYTAREFSKYADAIKLRSELDKAVKNKIVPHIFEICTRAYNILKQLDDRNSADDGREPHLERFIPNSRYIAILTSGSKHLTSYFDEVKIWLEYLISQPFCSYKRGEWYCHLALIYSERLRDHKKAAKLVIKAFREERQYFTDVQLQELSHRARIVNRKTHNLSPLLHDQIISLSPPSCDRNWPQDVLDCKSVASESSRRRTYIHRCENGDVYYPNVEETALQYYRTVGYPNGVHCEGSIIIASFSLLFWDIIYGEYVKGTFISSVQSAPLDMHTKYFYPNREKSIKRRLDNIKEKWKEAELKKKLIESWNLHSHETSLCHIDAVVDNPQHLYNLITCIGRPILSKIFERLVTNYYSYQSGFPDLILWNVEEKRAKFVEVKSENDKLSIKQKLWLNYLIDIGASVAVCHVEPKSSKKKLQGKK